MNAKKPHNQVPKDPEVGFLWPAEAGVSDTSWNLGLRDVGISASRFWVKTLLGQEPGNRNLGQEPGKGLRDVGISASRFR
uniref:Uncharacterized protein n=1 Tax=viral metagenome TaxID=1070528 RepID=A0A6C0JN96_9ZZZZ